MEKVINLKEIVRKNLKIVEYNSATTDYYYVESRLDDVVKIMKETIRQALELAAENAEVIERIGRDANPECFVDQQSILNTINQVKP